MPTQQGYIGRNPGDGRTVINRQTSHVTTGVQTSFTMNVGYEVGFLDVYLNGIKQTETLDYTASDGSTINFSPSFAPMNGDVLEFIAYETLNITNIKSARRNFNVGQDLSVDGSVTIGSSLTVATDLVVNGTFTTINTEILDVEDKTVGIASTSSPSNTTADGAGIVIYGGSDGDKSITWNSTKSNFVIVGGGVSIGTGVTISTPADNVLAFSVNSAEKARFNNFGAFTVGYEGEAWKESVYVGVLQAGSGAWIGQTPGAGARAEWVNNAYYDSVNTRWEYIAADEANRIYLENGELHLQSAAAGSADALITWNERLAMTVGGDFKIGPNAGIGITISSSGNVDAIGIITATSFSGSGANLTGIDTDLVSDTSPQLGGNLDNNGKNIIFGDSAGSSDDRLTFGAGTDLSIYHDSSNSRSRIEHSTDNALEILQGGNAGMLIQNQNSYNIEIKTNAEDAIKCVANGAVELYHNGTKKFESTSDGALVSGHLNFPDASVSTGRIRMGASDDLQLFHDSSDSFIINGTGQLVFRTASVKSAIVCKPDAAVELYHNNSLRFETTASGFKSNKAGANTSIIGSTDASGVYLVLDGDSNGDGVGGDYSYLEHGTDGDFSIHCDNPNNDSQFELYTGNGATLAIVGQAAGAVQLYHNGSQKIVTTSGGASITGVATATGFSYDFAASRNMIINGQMQVNQRNSSALTVNSSSGQYPVDRWVSRGEGGSKAFTIEQVGVSNSGLGVRNAIKVTSSQAASVSSSDIFNFRQMIEGLTSGRLNLGESGCASMTLSFTAYSSVAGTHSGAIQNSAQNRSYPFTYTLAQNTWTDVKITIPPITSGSFNESTGVGLRLVFDLGSGDTFRGTANQWNSAQDEGATGAVRLLETNGAVWYITKVQLEEGTVATPFEKKLFNEDLSACERYYYIMQANDVSYLPTTNDGRSRINRTFPTRMRAAPSGSMSNYVLSTKSDGVTGYQSSGSTDVLYQGTFDAEI
ncbi:hypothetical protein AVU42_gp024 [Prochlorococcus phage P-TIM68]|uniref:Uncharacterized protein n=1 Tax=Prochlorococcus phage P-TIM68 TaxID=1542477 RepID=A0A0K0KWC8_9CAUD|nr:hypothetical protein AVU42_gp024 [Prochlorococcus phage P-TIM68]AIR93409.1 hypothetical protein [Prochlorococcus phage P-TIM68]